MRNETSQYFPRRLPAQSRMRQKAHVRIEGMGEVGRLLDPRLALCQLNIR